MDPNQTLPNTSNSSSILPETQNANTNTQAWLDSYAPLVDGKTGHRKRNIIIALVLVVVVVLIVVAIVLGGSKTKSVQFDGVSFEIPSDWQKLTTLPSSYQAGYALSNQSVRDGAVYLKSTKVADDGWSLTKYTTEDRMNYQSAIVDQLKQSAQSFCTGQFEIIRSTALSSAGYFGEDIIYTCSDNGQGRAFTSYDRYLLASDGNYYQITASSDTANWVVNQGNLVSIVQSANTKEKSVTR